MSANYTHTASHTLFREQVLNKNSSKSLGGVLLRQPREYQWITYAIFFVIAASIVFLFMNSYTKYTDVFGVITVDKGLVKVTALREGQIMQQLVKQGDSVTKGDLMYVISTLRHSSTNQNIDKSLLKQQQQLQNSLRLEFESNKETHELDLAFIDNKISEKNREIEQLQERLKIEEQRLKLSNTKLKRNKSLLNAGHLNRAQLDQVTAEHLEIKSRYNELTARFDSLKFSLKELSNERELKPRIFNDSQNHLSRQIIENEQRIVEVSSNIDYRIYAPITGSVGTLLTHTGELVQKGVLLASIIPQDSKLQAELYVPSTAIGFIEPLQAVSMRYSAFPYQHFGLQEGKVRSVAKVISRPEELGSSINLSDAAYKVIVDLSSQYIRAKGGELELGVGMELEASIELENRTLIQWILEPIYSLRDK